MPTFALPAWPDWASRLAWTLLTLVCGWAAGMLVSAIVAPRAIARLSGRSAESARAALGTLHSRLPIWGVLVAVWLVAGYWPLTLEARLLVTQAVFALGAISVTLTAAALATDAVDHFGARLAPVLPVSSLTRNLVRAFVIGLGGLVVLNGLGVSITPMLTALGIGGLAVALALQEPLANLFAGLFVSIAGQLRVGDYVALDSGQEGYIVDVSWRSTRIRMLANNLVVVPNAKLAHSVVVNYHLPSEDLAVLVDVGVDYGSDLRRVERIAIDVGRSVMREVPGGVADFEPFVRYHTFADSSINFTMILRAREFVDQYLVKHEFIQRLHERFNQEGIVIPFPIRAVVAREPSMS